MQEGNSPGLHQKQLPLHGRARGDHEISLYEKLLYEVFTSVETDISAHLQTTADAHKTVCSELWAAALSRGVGARPSPHTQTRRYFASVVLCIFFLSTAAIKPNDIPRVL